MNTFKRVGLNSAVAFLGPRLNTRHHRLRTGLAFLAMAISGSAAPEEGAAAAGRSQRPNILFICTDDQAAWAIGSSNREVVTPNIDRLLRQGAHLKNFFAVTPVCSPSRVSIFTSRYGSELGVTDFIPHPEHPAYTPATGEVGLARGVRTFASVFADAGYVTGLVGKWHLGDWTKTREKDHHPTRHGFGYFMGLTGGGKTAVNPRLEEDGLEREFVSLTDDILATRAIQFLERNSTAPFLLCFNTRAPHVPWLPVLDEDVAPYRNRELTIPNPDFPDLEAEKAKQMMRDYLSCVSSADRNVGRVLEALDRLGLSESTIVIFTSDNGMNIGHNGIWAKGDGVRLTKTFPPDTPNVPGKYRPNMYDNSIRIPSIIRWTKHIKPGTVIDQTISELDWYPTLLAMAGVKLPSDEIIRGRNILPLLSGAAPAGWDDGLYGEYIMRVYARTDLRMFRTREWKLVRDLINPERDELYHLAQDPNETTNLIGKANNAEVYTALLNLDRRLSSHMEQIRVSLEKK